MNGTRRAVSSNEMFENSPKLLLWNQANMQPDHVTDLDWGGPDEFFNLWPLGADENVIAGRIQNLEQPVEFCYRSNSAAPQTMAMREYTLSGRWIVITQCRHPLTGQIITCEQLGP